MTKQRLGAWMKFYPADWLVSVRRMPLAARGAYLELLCHSWVEGSIPSDPEELARIVGVGLEEFGPLWGRWVGVRFVDGEEPGRLVNNRQESVRAQQEARVDQRAEAARTRWAGVPPEERSRIMAGLGRQSGEARRQRTASERGTSEGTSEGASVATSETNERGNEHTCEGTSAAPSERAWSVDRTSEATCGEREDSGPRLESSSNAHAGAREAAAPAAASPPPGGSHPEKSPPADSEGGSPDLVHRSLHAGEVVEDGRVPASRAVASRLIFEVLCPAGLGQSVIPEALELLQGPKWLEGRGEIETKAILRAKADQAPGKFSPGGWLLQVLRSGDATTPVKPRAPAGARGSPAAPAPEPPQDPTTATEWEAIASQLDLAADRCEALLPGQAEDLRAQAARAREEAEDLQGAANG